MEWHVNGKSYKVQWAHPKTFPGEIQPAGEDAFVIYIADESVPKNDIVDAPPAGDLHVIATKAQTAVGNVLRSRARIDFLRLIKQYPYGMEAGAIGLDGGGDPRAHPLQRDKAAAPTGAQRINTGLLAQPGAFPDAYVDTVPDEDIARANHPYPARAATIDDPTGPAGFAGPTGAELNPMLADKLTAAQIEDDRRARKDLDPKPRFDTVNAPLSELPQRQSGNGHEDQGTGYDSGAAGHEAQGRRSAPDPEREGIMRNPDGSPVIGPSGPTHAPTLAEGSDIEVFPDPLKPGETPDPAAALAFIESIGAGGPAPTETGSPLTSEPGELVPNKD